MESYREDVDYSKKLNLSLWIKLLRLVKPMHRKMWAIVISMSITALIESSFPLFSAYAIDHFIMKNTTDGLVPYILIYAAVSTVFGLLTYVFIYYGGAVEVGTCYLLRKLGFRKLQELPFSYYDRMPVGYLLSRMTGDIQTVSDSIGWALVGLVWSGVYILICAVQMLILNWALGLTVLLVVPPMAVVTWLFQQKILRNSRKVRKINSKIISAYNEGIMGAKTSKTLVREEQNIQEFDELAVDMRRTSIRSVSLSARFVPIVVSMGAIATGYALWQGGIQVGAGAMTIGVLQVFISNTISFFGPIREIAGTLSDMQAAQAAGERVVSLLETEPDIVDAPAVTAQYGDQFFPRRDQWPVLHGDVEFRDVSFQYKDGEKVLSHFNLKVNRGETIALVGETGSGKSTIVNLVCRFYEPTEGLVLIDGEDVRSRSQLWLQSNLGYVLQTPHLFSGTIRDNIAYGMPDATDEEVHAAAVMVGADRFIQEMADGYNTQVGEGGNRLSTGQKQVISLARAILCDPAIFILDEATSSVDTETEQMIQQAVAKVLHGRTSFIIAHRLSTIREADRILVIHDGEILEEGNHAALMKARGAYYKLYTNQFMEEQEKAVLNG